MPAARGALRRAHVVGLALLLLLGTACGHSSGGSSSESPGGGPPPPALAAPASGHGVDRNDPIAARLDSYFTSLEALGFSGAIVVEHQGSVVLRKGYGLADRESRRPYTPATVQTMGSITKQITAAAILLLDERGALDIDQPITRYLAAVPPDKEEITLHHLLTHQSGLPSAIGWDAEAIDAEAFLARALETPLEFAPGTGVEYSNVGYSILGILIERVTGGGYEDFIRRELLLPAGLHDTGYQRPVWPATALASGYREGDLYSRADRSDWLPDGPGWNLRANGGLRTTVDDMHRWLRVLQGAGPSSGERVARWTQPHVVVQEELALGYGWNLWETELGRLIAHTGGNPAFASAFGWLLDQELFYYLQGNTSLWPAGELEETVLRIAFDPELIMPPVVQVDPEASPAVAARRAGVYTVEEGRIRLTADDTRLRVEVSGQPVLNAILGHGVEERARFAQLNERAQQVVRRLEEGREDALEAVVAEATEAVDRSRAVLRLLERGGELRSLTVVGSVANVPGSHFADHGGSTTFVRAELAAGPRILSLLWRDDGSYGGAALGPLTDVPTFVLVPVPGGGYTGVEHGPPWRRQAFAFAGECLMIADLRACRDQPAAPKAGLPGGGQAARHPPGSRDRHRGRDREAHLPGVGSGARQTLTRLPRR